MTLAPKQNQQWGAWPPDGFTLESNRADLCRHHDEFTRGEAFAVTVLSPDRSHCLGCIYIEPYDEVEGAQLAFWVIDDAIDAEAQLVTQVFDWIHQAWSIDRVLIPLCEANARGITIVRDAGLVEWDSLKGGPLSRHRCFLSQC